MRTFYPLHRQSLTSLFFVLVLPLAALLALPAAAWAQPPPDDPLAEVDFTGGPLPARMVAKLPTGESGIARFLPGMVECPTADPIRGQTINCKLVPGDAQRWLLHWIVERADGANRPGDVQLLRSPSDPHASFRIYRPGDYLLQPRFQLAEDPTSRVVEGAAAPLRVRGYGWWRDWRWWATIGASTAAGLGFYCSRIRC